MSTINEQIDAAYSSLLNIREVLAYAAQSSYVTKDGETVQREESKVEKAKCRVKDLDVALKLLCKLSDYTVVPISPVETSA